MNLKFVGREKELKHILDAFETIVKQLPHKSNLLFIEGEAGVGKSALINQVVELLRFNKSSRVVTGYVSCEIFAKESSFLPFFQLLDIFRNQHGALSRISGLEKFNQIIGEVAPSWLKMLPLVGEAISQTVNTIREVQKDAHKRNSFAPSQQMDIDIYGQFLKILVKLSEASPVLMIIDDLLRTDSTSLTQKSSEVPTGKC